MKYYRTAKSVSQGAWYGVPVVSLTKLGDNNEDELEQIVDDIKKGGEAIVETVAKTGGLWTAIFHRNKK